MPVKLILEILGLAAVFVLWGCAAVIDQDSALAVAPYDINDNGLIIVEVRVNGQGPFEFALDTAASISVVFDKLRNDLALEPVQGEAVTIHGAVATGQFPLLNIDHLSVGREVWAAPRIASIPGETLVSRGIDGILGVDFLRRYAVGFSVRDRVVRLYPPDLISGRSFRDWTSIQLQPEPVGKSGAALYFFEIEIAGQRIPAIFDLGAGPNMINWPAANSLGLDPVDSRGDDQFSGAIETTDVVARFRIDEVTTGRIRWRNEVFSIAELEIFTKLLRGDGPCAILGAGLFTQRDFIIDFARTRLLVKAAMDEMDVTGTGDSSQLLLRDPVRSRLAGVREQHDTEPDREYGEHERARRELNNAVCDRSPG
ncbi:MAG: retroviral-like aspartic protease family protein [Gammaproteobacteria bacterium]|nr:retroviral-like aspartic protease family protein [Gammaproteobacteria bacterium]MDH3749577.1 retroviral-like aspartic protease family protein [Gammaproteobacteria bacterium]MDH3805938.1 retroviral-like aspartic protease family protein [Gammaproteobacteria bacterium]